MSVCLCQHVAMVCRPLLKLKPKILAWLKTILIFIHKFQKLNEPHHLHASRKGGEYHSFERTHLPPGLCWPMILGIAVKWLWKHCTRCFWKVLILISILFFPFNCSCVSQVFYIHFWIPFYSFYNYPLFLNVYLTGRNLTQFFLFLKIWYFLLIFFNFYVNMFVRMRVGLIFRLDICPVPYIQNFQGVQSYVLFEVTYPLRSQGVRNFDSTVFGSGICI